MIFERDIPLLWWWYIRIMYIWERHTLTMVMIYKDYVYLRETYPTVMCDDYELYIPLLWWWHVRIMRYTYPYCLMTVLGVNLGDVVLGVNFLVLFLMGIFSRWENITGLVLSDGTASFKYIVHQSIFKVRLTVQVWPMFKQPP